MKKIFCVVLSICLVLAMAACGKAPQPVQDPGDVGGKPQNTEPEAPLSEEELQVKLIADNVDAWYVEPELDETYLYAVTDLDENGRYELVSGMTEGSGEFTTLHFWEVSEDRQSLEAVKYTYGETNSEPDLFFTSNFRCYSKNGSNFIVVDDYLRNGYDETYYIQEWMSLRNGRVDVDAIAGCLAMEEAVYRENEDGGLVEEGTELNFYYYTGSEPDSDLDREQYIFAANDYFEDYDKRVCTIAAADIPVDAARDAGALFELLKTSMEGFSIAKNNGVFTTLAPDPESLYDSPGVYSKDYLLDTWTLTHIGGEADMQTAEEAGADSELSIIEGPEFPQAFFSYNNPTDSRGTYLLTEMPVYDSDGVEAPEEGDIHVEFMTGGNEGEEVNRFYAEIDSDDGSLWVTWFWWPEDDQGGDPTITYLRYVKGEG